MNRLPAIVDRPSPNHGPRAPAAAIDILLLHYTDMTRAADAVDRLCDRDAAVSAHYVVGEDGRVWQLVPEDRRAWHAGLAWWAGESDVNSRSVGVEIANPGHSHGYRRFPDAQMAALATLCRGILRRHPIPPHRVLGHSDVSPGRKIDPGHLFDWRRLAAAGIGSWPADPPPTVLRGAEIVALLARIGYRTEGEDPDHPVNRAALWAFRRRWCARGLDQPFDDRMAGMLAAVASDVEKAEKGVAS